MMGVDGTLWVELRHCGWRKDVMMGIDGTLWVELRHCG